jgi:chromate transporter
VGAEEFSRARAIRELILVFLKLGTIGFGGPAAHIAMMEEEVVTRRRWLTREHFLDLLGATNLIPGPNSTEMAIHLGYVRARLAGLAVAGISFILPAVLITGAFAWLYVKFGALPVANPFLVGIKPAVLAVILGAVWRLGRTVFQKLQQALIGAFVLAASLFGLDEIAALFGGGIVGAIFLQSFRRKAKGKSAQKQTAAIATGVGWKSIVTANSAAVGVGALGAASFSMWKLGLFFLKIGAVLYGSGYVLVAFLEGGLVEQYGWLTQQQLLDAIAIGQFTPGPVLSTATFIGYVLAGWPGAALATAAIFLPSFVFVAAFGPVLSRLRQSRVFASFLDAVNASSIALMVAVTIKLIPATITSWPAVVIAVVAIGASIFWRVNAAWLVLGGAIAGWLLTW